MAGAAQPPTPASMLGEKKVTLMLRGLQVQLLGGFIWRVSQSIGRMDLHRRDWLRKLQLLPNENQVRY